MGQRQVHRTCASNQEDVYDGHSPYRTRNQRWYHVQGGKSEDVNQFKEIIMHSQTGHCPSQ